MSKLRQTIKRWLYGSCPGWRGAFPYYGTKVYFPRHSLIFELACRQGIYEAENQYVLSSALRPHTTVFDVGANIGLMSVPLLAAERTLRVVSIEPSPATFAHLQRTVTESAWRDRWTALQAAAGSENGTIEFHCGDPALGAFDSIRDTRRGGKTTKVAVPIVTLDSVWEQAGRPDVCAIKIDVEGAESAALEGARNCLARSKPLLLVEWNAPNLAAFDCPLGRLLTFAKDTGYEIFAIPHLVHITSEAHLRAVMKFTESFVLLPAT